MEYKINEAQYTAIQNALTYDLLGKQARIERVMNAALSLQGVGYTLFSYFIGVSEHGELIEYGMLGNVKFGYFTWVNCSCDSEICAVSDCLKALFGGYHNAEDRKAIEATIPMEVWNEASEQYEKKGGDCE